MYSHDAEDIAAYRAILKKKIATNTENAEVLRGVILALGSFKGTTINKRLATHIMKQSPKFKTSRSVYNYETRKDEDKEVELDRWHVTLESRDYGKQPFTLVVSTYGNYQERESIWFEDVPDLIDGLTKRMEYLRETSTNVTKLIEDLPAVISSIDSHCNQLNKLMDIKGMFYISDNLPHLTRR